MDDPGLLILDEPFAGLDAATRDTLPSLIAGLAAEGATVVISDHQRCIESLPGIDRLQVANGTVTRLAPGEEPDAPRLTVLEVVVPEADADIVETKLRADGYTVRRPDQ
jgi:ABC-type cobalamin transport system ATPase subunit